MELTTYKAEDLHDRDTILPIGRLNPKQTGAILGFNEEKEIPILIAAGLLKPLGNPNPNCQKYFAWVDIQKKAMDDKWLAKATDAIYGHHAKENANRRGKELKEAA